MSRHVTNIHKAVSIIRLKKTEVHASLGHLLLLLVLLVRLTELRSAIKQ